ncbi:tyrosine-type recombinase/integrase [Cytobacillus oceanisediminis]|uniref:Integrase n=1 Tax=Cytobacillus oceanisediminis 2691 TaxID=1196031 RepID=A0A160MEB8_9BACI|nr:tyrosine-type recombinase/integrase [Cytobacillus oceanisediminis]AND41446.1 hypothetical protein A361_20525 [Cytobacillus oceanisediminis 2691]
MDIVSQFKDWLVNEQKVSEATQQVYLAAVRHFLDYYERINEGEFRLLERGVVNGYSLKLELDNIPAATINARITGLKKFNKFLVEKGYQKDIVIKRSDRVENNHLEIPKPEKLDTYEKEKFIQAVKIGKNKRDFAIMMLILKINLGASEIIELRLEDYRNGAILIKNKDRRFEYILNTKLQQVLDEYLNERINHHFSNSEFLFITNKSGKMVKRHIFQLFNKYNQEANLVNPITPKKLAAFNLKDEKRVIDKEFKYSLDDDIQLNCNTEDTKHRNLLRVMVEVQYNGSIRTFLFGAANQEFMNHLLLEGKAIIPNGLILTRSFNQDDICSSLVNIFNKKGKTPLEFLNFLEAYSIKEDEFNCYLQRL